MRKCPYCAEEIQDAAILCRYCNHEVEPVARTMKKCPYCAEEIQEAAVVCRYCRRDLPQPQLMTDAASEEEFSSLSPDLRLERLAQSLPPGSKVYLPFPDSERQELQPQQQSQLQPQTRLSEPVSMSKSKPSPNKGRIGWGAVFCAAILGIGYFLAAVYVVGRSNNRLFESPLSLILVGLFMIYVSMATSSYMPKSGPGGYFLMFLIGITGIGFLFVLLYAGKTVANALDEGFTI